MLPHTPQFQMRKHAIKVHSNDRPTGHPWNESKYQIEEYPRTTYALQMIKVLLLRNKYQEKSCTDAKI